MKSLTCLLIALASFAVVLGQQTSTPTASATSTPVPPTTRSPTTVAPGPTKRPDDNRFFLRDNATNFVCLILRLKADFNFVYPVSATKNASATAHFGRDNAGVAVSGSCDNLNRTSNETAEEVLELSWLPSDQSAVPWNLTFTILQEGSKFFVDHLQLDFFRDRSIFKDAQDVDTHHTIYALPKEDSQPGLFTTNSGSYYQCLSEQPLLFTEDTTMQVHTIVINAFRGPKTDVDYTGTRYQCSGDAFANNIVPIIVGCALAALMLLVLVTYLIGRRRARPGYQTI